MRSEYVQHREILNATGNDVDTAHTLPPYWDALVECLQDRIGIGSQLLADSEVSIESSEIYIDSTTSNTEKEEAPLSVKDGMCNGTRKERVKEQVKEKIKENVKEKGIGLMADAMKSGMIEIADAMRGKTLADGVSARMELVLEKLSEQVVSQ